MTTPTTTTTTTTETRGTTFPLPFGVMNHRRRVILESRRGTTIDETNDDDDDDDDAVERRAIAKDNHSSSDKFSSYQRIESIKTAIIGAISGSVSASPISAMRYLLLPMMINGIDGTVMGDVPSWEYDVDACALQGALFAIVYRYCAREDDDNVMLNAGVVGAFVLVRATSGIRVPGYCTALPLDCGDPLGYLDYEMISQLSWGGIESAVVFGGAALAMEYAYGRGWITKFPN